MTVSNLTFAELRFANLAHPPHRSPNRLRIKPLDEMDDAMLAQALAEMVIQADWMAAERGIDLVQAIQNRFATEGERGGSPNDLERKRSR